MNDATHIVLSESNSFPGNYTRKHRQYIVHVQVGKYATFEDETIFITVVLGMFMFNGQSG